MAILRMEIKGDGLIKFDKAIKKLGSYKKAHDAYRRALNKTGGI